MWWGETASRVLKTVIRRVLPAALAAPALLAAVARAEVKVGDRFPRLAAPGLVSLSGGGLQDTAGKVVLVDFWASWCAPCKASFSAMAKLHAELAGRGVAIVAVGVDEKAPAAVAFWKRLAPPFVGLHDSQQRFVARVAPPAMPTSYVIGRDGRVRFIQRGYQGDATEQELRRQVLAALEGK